MLDKGSKTRTPFLYQSWSIAVCLIVYAWMDCRLWVVSQFKSARWRHPLWCCGIWYAHIWSGYAWSTAEDSAGVGSRGKEELKCANELSKVTDLIQGYLFEDVRLVCTDQRAAISSWPSLSYPILYLHIHAHQLTWNTLWEPTLCTYVGLMCKHPLKAAAKHSQSSLP